MIRSESSLWSPSRGQLNSPPGCRTWLRPSTTSSSREALRITHTVSNERQMGPHGSTPSDRLATSAASRNHRVYSCFYSWDAMYRQHKRMRVGTFLTPERNTAAHNAHSPRTVRRRRCSAVPVATQGQLPAPLAVGPDHQIGNLEGARKTAFCLKLRTLKTIKGLQKLQNLYSDPPSSATRNNCGSPELPREINPFCTARLLDCQKLLRIQ